MSLSVQKRIRRVQLAIFAAFISLAQTEVTAEEPPAAIPPGLEESVFPITFAQKAKGESVGDLAYTGPEFAGLQEKLTARLEQIDSNSVQLEITRLLGAVEKNLYKTIYLLSALVSSIPASHEGVIGATLINTVTTALDGVKEIGPTEMPDILGFLESAHENARARSKFLQSFFILKYVDTFRQEKKLLLKALTRYSDDAKAIGNYRVCVEAVERSRTLEGGSQFFVLLRKAECLRLNYSLKEAKNIHRQLDEMAKAEAPHESLATYLELEKFRLSKDEMSDQVPKIFHRLLKAHEENQSVINQLHFDYCDWLLASGRSEACRIFHQRLSGGEDVYSKLRFEYQALLIEKSGTKQVDFVAGLNALLEKLRQNDFRETIIYKLTQIHLLNSKSGKDRTGYYNQIIDELKESYFSSSVAPVLEAISQGPIGKKDFRKLTKNGTLSPFIVGMSKI